MTHKNVQFSRKNDFSFSFLNGFKVLLNPESCCLFIIELGILSLDELKAAEKSRTSDFPVHACCHDQCRKACV